PTLDRHRHPAVRRRCREYAGADHSSSRYGTKTLCAGAFSRDRARAQASSTRQNSPGTLGRTFSGPDGKEKIADAEFGRSIAVCNPCESVADDQGRMIRLPASCGASTGDSFSGNCAKTNSTKARDLGRPEVRPCASRTRKTRPFNTSESRRLEYPMCFCSASRYSRTIVSTLFA